MSLRAHVGALSLVLAACGTASAPNASTGAPPSPVAAKPPAVEGARPEAEAPFLLPDDTKPLRYDLDLQIDPAQPTFTATVTIDVTFAKPTAVLWIHGKDLRILEAKVEGAIARPVGVEATAAGRLRLDFGTPLPAGAAKLTLRYEGKVASDKSVGLYRVQEPDGAWHAYTFFEPGDARRVFPGFDEPRFKVPFRLTIRVPNGQKAAANAPLSKVHSDGKWDVFAFDETVPFPTYLVAFVVGPFAIVEGGPAGRAHTPLRFVLPRGREGELGYAKAVTPRVVAYLEDYFGMKYPFHKLDVAVVPRFWGTMEHPGLVAMGQPLTLIPKDDETLARKRRYTMILAHELAHYWFGDYVTCASWDEAWLNESFATRLDSKIAGRVEPSWGLVEHSYGRLVNALGADSLASAKALRQPLKSDDDLESSFDNGITYDKGASVVRMIEQWVGEDAFQRAMRRYMNEHAFGIARAEDVYRALSAEAGPEAGRVLASFVDQPGVPVVDVEMRCNAGKPPEVSLVQSRFLRVGTAAKARWSFPVCLRWPDGKSDRRACFLLEDEQRTAPLPEAKTCPPWFVANAGGHGYHRTRYTAAQLRAVAAERKRLTVAEVIVLFADTMAFAAKNAAEVPFALELAVGAASDARPEVVRASSQSLAQFLREGAPDPAFRAARAKAVRSIFGARARRLGFVERPEETMAERDLRVGLVTFVALVGDDKALQDAARANVRAWLKDPKTVSSETLRASLSAAVASGDVGLFNRLAARAKAGTDRDLAEALYGSLARFREPSVRDRFLNGLLDGTFDLRDVGRGLNEAMAVPETRGPVFTFVTEHWDELAARLRADETIWLMDAATRSCDVESRAAAAAFFTPRAEKLPGGPRTLAKGLEMSDACIAEHARNASAVGELLARTR